MTSDTMAELAKQYDVHPNQIADGETQLLEKASNVFGAETAAAPAAEVKPLRARIGQLTLEVDFLETALSKAGLPSAKR
jgi:transposase-like protein